MKNNRRIILVALMFGLVMFWAACTSIENNPLDGNAVGHVPEHALDDDGDGIPNFFDPDSDWHMGRGPQASEGNQQSSVIGGGNGSDIPGGSVRSVVSSAPRSVPTSQPSGFSSIVLLGPNPFYLLVGTNYIEPGFIATDVDGSNITSRVFVDRSDLDIHIDGMYTIEYTVEDANGDITTAHRGIIVNFDSTSTFVPTTPPPPVSSVAAVSSVAVSSVAPPPPPPPVSSVAAVSSVAVSSVAPPPPPPPGTPTISATPISLSFPAVAIGQSATLSYTLSATGLTPAANGNIFITAPTGFAVSLSQATGFANSISVAYTNGALATRTIWVRFSPTTAQEFTGNITHTGGTATANVAVSGTGQAAPPPPPPGTGEGVQITQHGPAGEVTLPAGTHNISININWGDPGKTTATLYFANIGGDITISGEIGGVPISTSGAHHLTISGVPTNNVTGTITISRGATIGMHW